MVKIYASYKGGEREYIDQCQETEVDYMVNEYIIAFGAGWLFETEEKL